jgi:hypothetical protein
VGDHFSLLKHKNRSPICQEERIKQKGVPISRSTLFVACRPGGHCSLRATDLDRGEKVDLPVANSSGTV